MSTKHRITVTGLCAAAAFSVPTLAAAQESASEAPPSEPAASSTPPASEDAPDVVLRLRDGTVLRGTVTSREGDDAVVFRTASGESRRITVADLRPEPVEEVATTRPSRDRVAVEVTATGAPLNVGYGLSETVFAPTARGLDVQGRTLCATPCTLYVRRGLFALYTGGHGHWDLVTYLHATPEGTRIRMHSGYTSGVLGGLALEIIGGVFLTGGLVTAIVPALSPSAPQELVAAGVPIALAGAAMLVGGVVLRVRNPTGVESFSHGRRDVRAGHPQWTLGMLPSAEGLGAAVTGTF